MTARSTLRYVPPVFDCAARDKALRARAFVSIGYDLRPFPPTEDLGPYT